MVDCRSTIIATTPGTPPPAPRACSEARAPAGPVAGGHPRVQEGVEPLRRRDGRRLDQPGGDRERQQVLVRVHRGSRPQGSTDERALFCTRCGRGGSDVSAAWAGGPASMRGQARGLLERLMPGERLITGGGLI